MNPDRRLQLLQLSLARMSLLLHEASTGKIFDEQLVADIRKEADQFRADLVVVRDEAKQQRNHDKQLIFQLKENLESKETELVSCRRQRRHAEDQAMINAAQARRWRERYQLVDAERQDCEDEIIKLRQQNRDLTHPTIAENADRQEVWPVSDVQVCPACSEQQLVHLGQDFYECPYCELCFNLCMEQHKT